MEGREELVHCVFLIFCFKRHDVIQECLTLSLKAEHIISEQNVTVSQDALTFFKRMSSPYMCLLLLKPYINNLDCCISM